MPEPRVLLIEDDPAVRHGMAAFLREAEPFVQLSLQDVRAAKSYLTTATVAGGSVLRNQNPK